MTWTRIRTWVGTHPVAAITMGNAACLLPLVLLLALGPKKPAARPHSDLLQLGLVLLVYVGPILAAMAWSCVVGCLLGRSGVSIDRLWYCPYWMWLICCVAVLIVTVASPGGIPTQGRTWREVVIMAGLVTFMYGSFLTMGLVICMAVGLAVARRITRTMLRRGKWEVTRPVGREEQEE